jgi:hypothetical protein
MLSPGSIFFVGIPAAALGSTDAENGVSVEGGKVVLGNSFAGSSAADLQNSRYINLKGQGIGLVVDVVDGPGMFGFQDIDFENNGIESRITYGNALSLLVWRHVSLTHSLQLTMNDVGQLIIASTRGMTEGTAILVNTTLEHFLQISPKAANFSISPASNNLNVFTNEGAAGTITFSLPSAEPGFNFTFYVQNANNLIVKAFAGDTIRWGGSVTAAGGSISANTVGNCITLVAINNTEYIAKSIVGTWV